MTKRILSVILAIVLVLSTGTSVFASYDPTGYGSNYNNGYYGDYYYNNQNYQNYTGNYYLSSWAEDLEIAYDPTCYESMQREVVRIEAFLVFLRAVQKSLDRQGYSRLTSGYSSVPFTDYSSVNPYVQGEVNVLYANNILVGFDDNTMRANDILKRAEMAAIYSRFNRLFFNMGRGYNEWDYDGYDNYYNNNYNNYYNDYMFRDIEGHWAEQDIITAASNGIIRGMGNGYFDPDGSLTIEQIWKMLDCCVGYQGLKRSDVAYAMSQTFKIKFGKNIDEEYGTTNGKKITSLSVSPSTVSITEGTTKQIKVSIYPSNASYQKLQWSFQNSSDKNYASIEEAWNSGSGTAYVRVYGKRAKNSYITLKGSAMDGSGKTVLVKLKVTDGYDYDDNYDDDYYYDDDYITSITPSDDTVYLDVGESREVSARIKPNSADYKELKWSSSDTSVARVSDQYLSGNYSYATITGKREGTTYVNVKAQDGSGESATIKVVVNDDYTGYPDYDDSTKPVVSLEGATSVDVGDTIVITVKAYDETQLEDFNIGVNSIIGMTGALSPTKVEKVSNSEYRVTLMGVEVASQCICVEAGAAIDEAGNTSEESNEIVIFVNSGEE